MLRGSKAHVTRAFACALILIESGIPAFFPKAPLSRKSVPDEAIIEDVALALPASCVLRISGRTRRTLVHLYKRQFGEGVTAVSRSLPRYAGAGDTSVHRAFREIERRFGANQHYDAAKLSEVLAETLVESLRDHSVEPLMSFWNARFSSDVSVDLLVEDLPEFEEAFERLISAPEFVASLSGSDRYFLQLIWHERYDDLEAISERHNFDSAMDLIEDLHQGADLVTEYEFRFSRVAAKLLKRKSPLQFWVYGLREAAWIKAALEDSFPVLQGRPWRLGSKQGFELGGAMRVDPSQNLFIVLSESQTRIPRLQSAA